MPYPKKLLLRAEWGGRRDSLDNQIQMTWQCWQRFAAHGRFMDQVWYTLNVDDAEQVIPLPDFESLREDTKGSVG